MRPIFTVHAGEYLVGEYVHSHYRDKNVWVPTKDTGIDLLVTNSENTRSVSLQVKFSRDYLHIMKELPAVALRKLRACTWFKIDTRNLANSRADYWVFVLPGFEARTTDYAIVSPEELLRRLRNAHGNALTLQVYFWVTGRSKCWLTRGLSKGEKNEVAEGTFQDQNRDMSHCLNAWNFIEAL